MLVMICSAIQIIFEIITEYIYMGLFCDKKPVLKGKGKYPILAGLFLLEFLLSFFLQNNGYLRITVVILCVSFYFFLILKINVLHCVTLVATFLCFTSLYEYIGLLLFLKLGVASGVEEPVKENVMLIVFALLKTLICSAALWIMKGKQGKFKKLSTLLSAKEWSGILLMASVTILILFMSADKIMLLDMRDKDILFAMIGAGISVLDIAIIWLFTKLIDRQQHILENEEILNRIKNETSLYHSLADHLEKQRKRSHEFDNQIAAIKSLIAQGKIKDLEEYIDVIDTKKTNYQKRLHTNHAIIDAILTAKWEEMQNQEILFIPQLGDLSEINISNDDLVVLLSNLLNNAMEACSFVKEKQIKMKFVIENEQVILSVKNTIGALPKEVDGEFITIKEDNPESHGIGLQNVKSIIKKYDGNYVIEFDEEWFFISMIIPL